MSLLDQLVRLQGYERVASSELDDTGKIFATDELAADESVAYAPELVAVEITHELVHHLRACP
jgi:hypothetical protein